jgi:hypothetical protein
MIKSFHKTLLVSVLIIATGCAGRTGVTLGGPQVFILQSPVHPAKSQTVTYEATAEDAAGISRIEIREEQRTLQVCGSGQTQPPCSTVVTSRQLAPCTFNAPLPIKATCTVQSGSYPDSVNFVGYGVTATNGSGFSSSEGYIYYAVGAYPWPNDPIPVYLTGDKPIHETIDLVFMPDKDYATAYPVADAWQEPFMQDVSGLLKNAYLSGSNFSREVRSRRSTWNFYVTYEQADAVASFGCILNAPANWANLRMTVNAGLIVHTEDLRDCSQVLPDGSLFSSEPASYVPAIHETGHGVYGLADEYCGGGLFESEFAPNVHSNQTRCRDMSCKSGAKCSRICSGQNWFRCDDGADVMATTSSVNNVFDACDQRRITWKHAQCAGGGC